MSTENDSVQSVLDQAMNRDPETVALSKSIKLRQADEAGFVIDRIDGMTDERKDVKATRARARGAADRLVAKGTSCFPGTDEDDAGGSSSSEDEAMSEEDDAVRLELGDSFSDNRQTHNHYPAAAQGTSSKWKTLLGTGALVAGVGTGLGGLGLGTAAWLNPGKSDANANANVTVPAENNVDDSGYDVLFFDKDGNPIDVKRLNEAPDDVRRRAASQGDTR